MADGSQLSDENQSGDCLLCAMEQADEGSVVFRDDLWAAEIVPGYEVPGWFILRARRHAERITGLGDDELAALGYRARDLVTAITQVTGAPATYLLAFGENYPHFHMLIAAVASGSPQTGAPATSSSCGWSNPTPSPHAKCFPLYGPPTRPAAPPGPASPDRGGRVCLLGVNAGAAGSAERSVTDDPAGSQRPGRLLRPPCLRRAPRRPW